VLLFCDFNRFL
jgi:DnaJ-class molecular chaperone